MDDKQFLETKNRLKELGFLATHDSCFKEIFKKNGFVWKAWWDELCDGWYNSVGLKNAGDFYNSTFGKDGEDLIVRWIFYGDREYLEPVYRWFSQKMNDRLGERLQKNTRRSQDAESTTKQGYIYLLRCSGLIKIGRTKKPRDRYIRYITENPNRVYLVFQKLVRDYCTVEKHLKDMFADKRKHGEWFKLNDEDIKHIKKFLLQCR